MRKMRLATGTLVVVTLSSLMFWQASNASATAPATPSVTSTVPASPHSDLNPEVKGTAAITELGNFGTQGCANAKFDSPRGVSVAPTGDVYVADPFGCAPIQRFTSAGIWESSFGAGSVPYDVAVAPSGDLFIADTNNDRIQKRQADGTFVTQWGSAGSGDGQFADPQTVTVGPSGDVYVGDTFNSRIQQFQSDGTFVRSWSTGGLIFGITANQANGDIYAVANGIVQRFASDGTAINAFGSQSNGRGADVSGGYLYVVNSSAHNITQYTLTGTVVRTYGQCCLYSSPNDIDFGSNGDAYVADAQNRTVHRLAVPSTVSLYFGADCSGSIVATGTVDAFLGNGVTVTVPADQTTPIRATSINAAGEASPCSSALDYTHDTNYDSTPPAAPAISNTDPLAPSTDGSPEVIGTAEAGSTVKLYKNSDCSGAPAASGTAAAFAGAGLTVNVTADSTTEIRATASDANNNVSACSAPVFYTEDSTGSTAAPTVSSVSPASPNSDNNPKVIGSTANNFIRKWGSLGSGAGELQIPRGAAVSPNGDLYVADSGNFRIQQFSPIGSFVRVWGSAGTGDGQFGSSDGPTEIDVAPNGDVYVADRQLHRIQRFSATGTFLGKWGSFGSGDGLLNVPEGVAVAPNGEVLVLDTGNGRIQRFSSTGTFISKFGTAGSLDGRISTSAAAIDVAPSGDIYIADTGNSRIQRFNSSGTFLGKATGVSFPRGVDAASNGSVFAADSNGRVVRYGSDLSFVSQFGFSGTGDGQFSLPRGVAAHTNGDVYTVDFTLRRVQQFGTPANVKLYTSSDCSGSSVGTGSISTFTAPGIATTVGNDSTTTFNATTTDLAGNGSACSASSVTYVEDSTGPTVAITSSDPASPSNVNTPRLIGTAGDASTVTIYTSSDCTGVAGQDGGSNFTGEGIGVAPIASNATTTFYAQGTDSLGNVGPCSSGFAYVEDSTAPDIPTITSSSPSSPANDNDPEIIGTSEAGSTVKVSTSDDGSCNGGFEDTGSASEFASTGLTVNVPDDQTVTVFAQAIDSAGNVSGCDPGTFSYTEDSSAAPTPTVITTDPQGPANNNNPKIIGDVGSVGDDATVLIFTNDTCIGSPVASGPETTFESGGLSVTVANDSSTMFYAQSKDAANNLSLCSAEGVIYEEDSTAPATPEITGTDPGSPSQSAAPKVIGTAEAGTDVIVYVDGEQAATESAATFASPGIALSALTEGSHDITATAVDPAGNASSQSEAFTYVRDLSAPSAPSITSTDPASPAQTASPSVIGTAESGSTVQIFVDGDLNASGSQATFGSGGIALSGVTEGSHTLTAKATDAAGNTSLASGDFTYVRDVTAPSAPTLDDVDPDSPANDNSVEVKGTAVAGSTVKLFTTATCTGSPIDTGSAAEFASPGLDATVADDSSTTFRATATDEAGNTSSCSSSSIDYIEDSTGPAAPTITSTVPASPSDDNEPEVKGTAAADAVTVQLYKSSTCLGAVAASGTRTDFASTGLTVTVVSDSVTPITARAIDASGNLSACSAVFNYTERSPVTFSIDDASISEGNSGASILTFNVNASRADTATMSVKAATANATAIAPTDYLAFPLTKLTFAPDETTKPVNVTINGDLSNELTETFLVNLSAPVGGTIADGQAVGTITEDSDPIPSMTIADVTKRERDTTTTFAFTVSLSEVSGFDVTFTAATQDGTAIAGKDYVAIPPTQFTIPAGDKDGAINVKIKVKGDGRSEGAETFFVNLSDSSSNVTIADAQAVGTIKNDD
jgi:sugar lactone lactonase YvrE